MPLSVRCRTALATGAVGLLAAVSIPAGSNSASAVDTDAHKYVELEIVNATDENLDLDAKLSSNGSQGRTASKERNGIKPLPTSTFDSGKGARQSYALDFVGDYDWKEKIGFIYDYKNFLNVQAASPSTPGKSQTTLTHEGRVYGEAESKKVAVNASAGNADPYRFTLEEQEQPASGFDKKYRLVISKDNIYDGNRSGFVPDVKRLTSSGRAVYKVTVPERTQKLASVPADLKVGPYTVFGRGFDPTSGKEIGKVVPVGKPTVDRANKTVTFPKATFFFEYPEGYFPQYYLTVLDEAGLGGTQELSRVSGPPAGLDQSAITAISAAPATGNGVPANGVAQEALKLKLTASGETVGPDHRPELNALYDHLYFRDGNGKLITGMYEGPAAGGYSAVSDVKGAYVNELGGMRQSSAGNNRAYVSTTKATPTIVRAELNVSRTQQSPEARVERSDAVDTAQGGAGSGVSLTKGIVDPADGAFHHYNGDKPEASLITRYPAVAALSSLPLKNPYRGHLAVQNNGASAKLNQPESFDPSSYVQTHLVNGVGTHVNLPSLAT